MFCKHCGGELKSTAKFCKNCGKSIEVVTQDKQVNNKSTTKTQIQTNTQNHSQNNLKLNWPFVGIIVIILILLYAFIIKPQKDKKQEEQLYSECLDSFRAVMKVVEPDRSVDTKVEAHFIEQCVNSGGKEVEQWNKRREDLKKEAKKELKKREFTDSELNKFHFQSAELFTDDNLFEGIIINNNDFDMENFDITFYIYSDKELKNKIGEEICNSTTKLFAKSEKEITLYTNSFGSDCNFNKYKNYENFWFTYGISGGRKAD